MLCNLFAFIYSLTVVSSASNVLHADRSVGNMADMDKLFYSHFDEHNQEAYRILQSLHKSTLSKWTFVNKKEGVEVWKQFFQESPSYLAAGDIIAGKKHAVVKSMGIINASPEDVFNLFLDNTRVREYNDHCVQVRDIEIIPQSGHNNGDNNKGSNGLVRSWSKVAWAASPTYGVLKARDFCSVVHYQKHANGSFVILNRPAYFSKTPNSKNFVHATILLAGNIVEPYGPAGNQTLLTQIAHINPGGISDTAAVAWIINKLCAVGPPTFIRKLEIAAQKSRAERRVAASDSQTGSIVNPLQLMNAKLLDARRKFDALFVAGGALSSRKSSAMASSFSGRWIGRATPSKQFGL